MIKLAHLALASASALSPSEPMPWFCDEVVIIGRAKLIDVHDLSGSDDLLGRFTRRYSVKAYSWLRGSKGPTQITVVSTGHGQLRENRDLLFFLVSGGDGSWKLRSAVRLRGGRVAPVLATTCAPRP